MCAVRRLFSYLVLGAVVLDGLEVLRCLEALLHFSAVAVLVGRVPEGAGGRGEKKGGQWRRAGVETTTQKHTYTLFYKYTGSKSTSQSGELRTLVAKLGGEGEGEGLKETRTTHGNRRE